jgi:hypothetical protein
VISRLITSVGAGILLLSTAAQTLPADGDIGKKQQAQQQARAQASELVSSVLELQLRQLEENGLKALPIYRDVAAMKNNLGRFAYRGPGGFT